MSAKDYGSINEDVKKKDATPPYEQGRAWESRGTILGLLIDVGGATASQVMMLIPMVSNSLTSDGTFLSCSKSRHPVMESKRMLYLCEYLTAFALAFPVVAITATMLIVGRNLLQKRFYYAMLQAGGVVTFAQNDVFKEVIFWIIVVSYLHCIAYLFFVIYVADQEGNVTVNTTVGFQAGDNEWIMILSCISLLILPGGLFTAFFYSAYDVEGTLVPLSQYVHDAEDMYKKKQIDMDNAVHNLKVVDDMYARVVLTEQADQILKDEGDYEEKCGMVLDIYRRNEDELHHRALNSLGLFSSFWPGQLLLKPAVTGEAGKYFKLLWFTIVSVFLVLFTCLISFLATSIYLEVKRAANSEFSVLPSIAVLVLHLTVVVAFLWPFLESLTWRWAHSPLTRVVEEGNSARSQASAASATLTGTPDMTAEEKGKK